MERMFVAPIHGEGVLIAAGPVVALLNGAAAVASIADVRQLVAGLDPSAAIRVLGRDLLRRELTSAAVVARTRDIDEVFAFGPVDILTTNNRLSAAEEIVSLSRQFERGELVGIVAEGASAPLSWQALELGSVAASGFTVVSAVVSAEPAGDESKAASPVVADPPAEAVVASSGTSLFTAGITPGSGFVAIDLDASLDDTDMMPLAIGLPDRVEPDADAAADVVADEAGGTASDTGPLPLYARPVPVLGVLSPRGFFNHPEARYCSRSGVKIGASHTRAFVQGERPALGVISFDDGTSYTIKWDTVVGRNPELDERVVSGAAAGLALGDHEAAVSRRHLLLELREWDLLVSDLGTANGTFVRTRNQAEPRRLTSGEKVVISHADEVFLGDRSFVYHEHHTR
jgi:hypothetical protein